MDGIRVNKYSEDIQVIKENIAKYSDIDQVAILHEVIDDTPYKTKSYMKYINDEYYIKHNKEESINNCEKFYELEMEGINDTSNGIVDLIKNRHSIRDYKNKHVSFKIFSQILYYSMGVKFIGRGAYDQRDYPFKYSNNQGGLNYLDLYIIVNNVENIEPGLYYYDFIGNRICQLDRGNMRTLIGDINFQNEFTVYSNFMGIVVADLSRVVPKYYKRAYRFSHVDSGILTAYLQLLSENNGISSCIVAGFLEHKVEELLNLTEHDYPIATISFGYKGGSV